LSAVVEIEKSPSRQLNEMLWNFLAECRHQTQIGSPIVHHHFAELWRFDPAGEYGKLPRKGESADKRFVICRVWILPKADLGVRVLLRGIVRGGSNDGYAVCKFTEQQF